MTKQPYEITELVLALDDEDHRRQKAVVEELASIGAPAVPALTQALGEPSERIRLGAVRALGRIGKPAEPAAPALIRMLQRGERPERPGQRDFRAEAAEALGELGARTAVPALIQALQDENYLCVCAALALGQLGDPAAVSPLVGVLMDKDKFWVPRGAAAVALGSLRGAAMSAIPALRKAQEFASADSGEKWDERAGEAVADALRRIADPSAPSLLNGKGYRYEMWGIY